MTKSKIGGNSNGIGFYEILKLGLDRKYRLHFYVTMFMIKCNLNGLTKRMLGIK